MDIRVDGTSIFSANYAALNKGGNLEEHAEDYPAAEPTIQEGSIVTFHVIRSGGAEDITGSLEMETVSEDSDESE